MALDDQAVARWVDAQTGAMVWSEPADGRPAAGTGRTLDRVRPYDASERVALAWRLVALGVVLRRVDPDLPPVAVVKRRPHAGRPWHVVFGGWLALATRPLAQAEVDEADELVRRVWRAER